MIKNFKPSARTIIGSIVALLILSLAWWLTSIGPVPISSLSYTSIADTITEPTIVAGPKMVHQEMPSEVRAVYMTACYGASKVLRNKLVSLIDSTELNSIIIDIKDYTGTIAVPTKAAILEQGQEGSGCKIRDVKEFIELLHSKGIYVIGRITVFQDPLYAKHHPGLAVHKASAPTVPWADHKGLQFIDVGAKEYWDYIVALSKESHDLLGFDELNFDYVRYPSDGPMSNVYYTHSGVNGVVTDARRAANLEEFFIYLHKELSKPNARGEIPYTSADLFGMTATNYDDLTIGQVLERALPYFDVIAPMVYPSHYPKGFLGFSNVNDHSYEIVHYSMKKAVERTVATETRIASMAYTKIESKTTTTDGGVEQVLEQQGPVLYKKPAYSTGKLRAWIQDFDYGGDYGIPEVNAQIQANRDAGVTGGYMIWDPANRYTRGVSY